MTRPVSLIVTPPEGGMREVGGFTRYVYGGQAYRDQAAAILSPLSEVRHLDGEPDWTSETTARLVDERLSEANAIVFAPWLIRPPVFDGDRLGRATSLKVIAGTFDFRLDWVDLDEAVRRGVTIVDTSRTMTWTVAEFGVAITFALLRQIPDAIELVRNGGWLDSPMADDTFTFGDLADRRVGLAGYGSINRHYRRFVEPYRCQVNIFDPFVSEDVAAADEVIRMGSLVELSEASDILIVAIPPMPSTLGVIDADVIDALPTGSLFVLLTRMAVVDQDALWTRVREGELRAAVDVFQPEPPPSDAWFRRAPNVLPTPHIAGNTRFAHERCFTEACEDAARVLRGEPPHHGATVRDKRLYDGTLVSATPEVEQG